MVMPVMKIGKMGVGMLGFIMFMEMNVPAGNLFAMLMIMMAIIVGMTA